MRRKKQGESRALIEEAILLYRDLPLRVPKPDAERIIRELIIKFAVAIIQLSTPLGIREDSKIVSRKSAETILLDNKLILQRRLANGLDERNPILLFDTSLSLGHASGARRIEECLLQWARRLFREVST